MRHAIAEVAVVPAGTDNPWGRGLTGPVRASAFKLAHRGETTPGIEFWFMPYSGAAMKLTDPKEQIDWSGFGLTDHSGHYRYIYRRDGSMRANPEDVG